MKTALFLQKNVRLFYGILLLVSMQTMAQKEAEKIKNYLQTHADKYHLSANDLKEMSVSSAYLSPTTGWYHIYYTQVYQSIEVYNGLLNATLVNNEVAHVGNQFIEDLPAKIANTTFFTQLSPVNAIDKLAGHLSLTHNSNTTKQQNVNTF